MDELKSHINATEQLREPAKTLTPFAVQVHYPFHGKSPAEKEAQQTIQMAHEIKQFADTIVKAE